MKHLLRTAILTLTILSCSIISLDATGQENSDRDAFLHKAASEHWHTWRKNQTRLPIAAWSYFDRYEVTQKEYDYYEQSGMTLVAPPLKHYEMISKTGLDIILAHFQPVHEDRELLEKTVAFPDPGNNRVIAYSLKDEPFVEAYPALSKAVEYIYRNDKRDAIPIIDFRPNWSVPYKRWNMTYETYFERFLDEVHPCVALNCHYPVMRDGTTRAVYYANHEYFRKKALEYDIGLMGFILITGHGGPNTPNKDYRMPSESDVRWQAYTYLAYGAQGLWYYNWRISSIEYKASIVDGKTAEPTELFPIVAELNEDIQAISPTLMKLRSTGVYHTGQDVPVGTTRFYGGFIKAMHGWSGDGFIIGEFENQDDPADDSVYIMIVNKRHAAKTSPQTLRVSAEFAVYPDYPDVTCLNPADDSKYSLRERDGMYSLDINGGQGVLLKIAR